MCWCEIGHLCEALLTIFYSPLWAWMLASALLMAFPVGVMSENLSAARTTARVGFDTAMRHHVACKIMLEYFTIEN